MDEAVPESVVVERVTDVELEQADTNAAAVRTTAAALGRFVMSVPPAPATSTTYFSPSSDASEVGAPGTRLHRGREARASWWPM